MRDFLEPASHNSDSTSCWNSGRAAQVGVLPRRRLWLPLQRFRRRAHTAPPEAAAVPPHPSLPAGARRQQQAQQAGAVARCLLKRRACAWRAVRKLPRTVDGTTDLQRLLQQLLGATQRAMKGSPLLDEWAAPVSAALASLHSQQASGIACSVRWQGVLRPRGQQLSELHGSSHDGQSSNTLTYADDCCCCRRSHLPCRRWNSCCHACC